MRIGLAYDLKPPTVPAGAPDDAHEEFDSEATIAALAGTLEQLGHTVTRLGDGRELLAKLLATPVDLVFNFAEGTGTARSREARVPAVCEMLGIPHTGSDPLALAVALEKDLTRRLAADAGVTVPSGVVLRPPPGRYDGDFAEFPAVLESAGLAVPVIAKPVFEGSSKGIRSRCLVERVEDFGPTVAGLWADYGQPVLVEEFVAGEEVTVGLIGNDPPAVFGLMKVSPKTPAERFVYSLEVKRDFERLIDYECPARLAPGVAEAVVGSALAVWDALGLRDVCRMDFRIRDGVPYFLEANPLPGLNPAGSDLVIMGGLLGVRYQEVVGMIVDAAATRYGLPR
jgi:D-alanine-D-alanine ligase